MIAKLLPLVLLAAFVACASTGCSSTALQIGKVKIQRSGAGTKLTVGDAHFEFYENGQPKIIDVKATTSDQVQGLKAVAEGVAKGLAAARP